MLPIIWYEYFTSLCRNLSTLFLQNLFRQIGKISSRNLLFCLCNSQGRIKGRSNHPRIAQRVSQGEAWGPSGKESLTPGREG